MRSGKIIKLNLNKNFKIKIGAIENYKEPKSIYFNISSWVKVNRKIKNLDVLIKEYRTQIKNYLKYNPIINTHFNSDNIIQLEIRSDFRLNLNKPTFFILEVNLYQKNKLPLVRPKNSKIEDLKPKIESIITGMLNLEFIANNKNFDYQLMCNKEKEEIE